MTLKNQDEFVDLDVSIIKTITRLRIISRHSAIDRKDRIGKVPVLGIAKYDVTRFRRMKSINLAASAFKLSDSGSLTKNQSAAMEQERETSAAPEWRLLMKDRESRKQLMW